MKRRLPAAFVNATHAHAEAIAPRLWFRDAHGLSPEETAVSLIDLSFKAWAAVSPAGTVLALFGLYRDERDAVAAFGSSIIGGARQARQPWALVSSEVLDMKATFWRASLAALELLLGEAPQLYGRVDATARRNITWLRRLGFSIGGPHNMPPAFPFVTFHIEKRAT